MTLRTMLARLLRHSPLFQALEMEISSPCNLACETCPNKDHRRPRAELPMAVIEKVIGEAAALGFMGAFSPHFYNEPLLDDRLEKVLALVRERLPKSRVHLFTNFTPMTPERYRALLPLVDEFIVTTDEPRVREAVDAVSAELTHPELAKLKARSIQEAGMSNRAGAVDVAEDAQAEPMRDCPFAGNLTIDAWGDVHLCCNDYFGKAVFGNVKERSLADIWFDPAYVKARKLGSRGRHPLCRGCFWIT